MVNGDRGRLRQVLTNLLSNAVKFTEAGEVTVRVRTRRAAASASTSPTPASASRATRSARLFDSFAQADTSTTRRYGGTGLGLTISRQLVELMGGEIGVVSTLGEGSTFSFTVRPRRARHRRAPARRVRHALPDSLQRARRRRQRDQPRDRRGLPQRARRALRRPPPPATEALTAMHAAARAGEPFELVVLDGQMPGMDGIELAQAISLAPSLRGARLLMLTSTTDRRVAARDGRHRPLPAEARPPRAPARDRRRGDGHRSRRAPRAARAARRRRRPRADTLLVVEDNAVNQRVIEAMLDKRGFAVEIADNGREALTMLAMRSYALVFMDCQMPEMDGYAATAAIRGRESGVRRACRSWP